MSLSGKQKTSIALFSFVLVSEVGITIFRYIVEKLADKGGVDKYLDYTLAAIPEWLVIVWNIATGELGIGVAIGAILIAFWEPTSRFFKPNTGLKPLTSPIDFAKGLYVGEIHISTRNLTENLVLNISIHVFNATGDEININTIKGSISVCERAVKNSRENLGNLPGPHLVDRGKNEKIAHLKEHLVIIEQPIPRGIANAILGISGIKKIEFCLSELNILAAPATDPLETIRLPLDDRIVLREDHSRLHISKVIGVTAKMKALPASFKN